MIRLSMTPCENCKNFNGTKWRGKAEATEYIRCKVAKDNDAKNLLKYDGGRLHCDKQVEIEWR